MSDIDRVFARFQDGKSPSGDRREVRTVRGRGTRGSRVVEVVHVRSGGAGGAAQDPPRPSGVHLRAATWDDGFPARQAPLAPLPEPPPLAAPAEPTAHVMPAWEPTPASTAPVEEAPPQPAPRRPRAAPPVPERQVADPFDASDEGANCLRCGYLVEPAREKRGLMTCAACG